MDIQEDSVYIDVYAEVFVDKSLETTLVTTSREQLNKLCYMGIMECHSGTNKE